MAYENLISAVKAVIKQNGNEEITGEIMQASLLAMIDSLGTGFRFMGVANIETIPEANDTPRFYLAADAGEYIGFGLKAEKPGVYVISNPDNLWRIEALSEGEGVTVDDALSADSANPVQNKVIALKFNELNDKTKHPVIKISTSEAGTGTVTSHTWDEIRKFIQNEMPIRVLFDGLDIATPLEVHYQDAEDGYYSGIISTADFRREFRIDHTLSVDITDTYYPETFIFETNSGTTGEDESVTYNITTDIGTIKTCIAAANARKGNQRIVVNTPDGRFCEFSIVYPRTDSLRALTAFGDTGYALSLSPAEYESTMIVKDGIIDLSDYYTKEETNTKLSGYALKDSVPIITDIQSDEDMMNLVSLIISAVASNKWETTLTGVEIGNLGLFEKYPNIGIFDIGEGTINYCYLGSTSQSLIVVLEGAVIRSFNLSQIILEYIDATHSTLNLAWITDKQSDWKTSNSSDASFIKNKPTKLSQFENDENFDVKDRAYVTNQNMGYKVLDKDKSIISQMTEANTIYEIRYDFDLNGETLTVPENCTLKFEGGSLKNGSVVGDNLKAKNLTANQISYGVFKQGVNLGSDNQYLIASEVGFVPNDANFAGHNSDVLTAVLSKTTAGLDFDNTYYLSGTHDVSRELRLKNGSLIISGNGTFVPKAGASIIIDNVSVSVSSIDVSTLIMASSIDYTIDAIILTNCIFSDYCRVINISGADLDYVITKAGIFNLVIDSNRFIGRSVSRCLFYDIVVSNRCYLTNNVAENFDYSLFYFAETNEFKYSGTKSAYWADIIFENNVINGAGACNGTSYITPLLTDGCNKLYYRNNIIKNLIATEITGVAYECYGSCNEYYCENNTVINVCKLPIKADESTSSSSNYTWSEIFKSKSAGAIRFANGNKWSIDYNECRSIVEAAKQIQFTDNVFSTLNYVALFGFVDTIDSLVFIDNTITINNGGLALKDASFPVGMITITGNTFKADSPASGVLCPYWSSIRSPKTIQVSRNKFDMVFGMFSRYSEITLSKENVIAIVNDNVFYQDVTGLLPNTCLSLTLQNNIFHAQTGTVGAYRNVYGYLTNPCFIDNLLVKFKDATARSFNIKYYPSWVGLMTFKLNCALSPTNLFIINIANNNVSTVVDYIIGIGPVKNKYRVTTTETNCIISDVYGNTLKDEKYGDARRETLDIYNLFNITYLVDQTSVRLYITAKSAIDTIDLTVADPSQNIFDLPTETEYNSGLYKYNNATKTPLWWNGTSWVEAVDTSNKQDKPTIEGLTNAQSVSVTGESSKLYSGASLTSLTIMAAKTDNSQNGAEEVFQFSTGASPAIAITGVSWANSDAPTFEADKTYEIHIMYNSTLNKFLATYAVYE